MKVYFFQCNKCGNYRYTTSTRQYAKCLKCGHNINLRKINKVMYNITISQAPAVLKEIKRTKSENTPVGFYNLREREK